MSSEVTMAEFTRRGWSVVPRFTAPARYAPTSANDLLRSRNSTNSGAETQNWSNPSVGNCEVMNTSRSGCWYGSGFNSTPFTTLKMALFTPMPSASVSTVTTA